MHHLCSNLQLHAALWTTLLFLTGYVMFVNAHVAQLTQTCHTDLPGLKLGPFPLWTHAF